MFDLTEQMQRVDKKFPFKSVFALTVAIVFYFNLFLSLSLSDLNPLPFIYGANPPTTVPPSRNTKVSVYSLNYLHIWAIPGLFFFLFHLVDSSLYLNKCCLYQLPMAGFEPWFSGVKSVPQFLPYLPIIHLFTFLLHLYRPINTFQCDQMARLFYNFWPFLQWKFDYCHNFV